MEMEAAENICTLLNQHGIYYRCYEHPAVSTCEQARALLPAIPALETKNLFLRHKNGKRHFLIALPAAKNLNLLSFAPLVNASRLSFASAERLKKYLNVKPGAVPHLRGPSELTNTHKSVAAAKSISRRFVTGVKRPWTRRRLRLWLVLASATVSLAYVGQLLGLLLILPLLYSDRLKLKFRV